MQEISTNTSINKNPLYFFVADGNIDETEFIAHWTLLKLGDLEHAVTLFHRADTDRNGEISKNPDFARLFYYFDRDGDHKIAESEFLAVWYSLST
ncbi:uncharacterized protein LOC127839775 [Dreissena polymorpha]|uniref:uncharacterized protein LOC127839775 n=1 Tax=Dreissena polymorpha TaxID=45954 RepID=UPI002265322E|nr:uncharacterized protein LOC127839775 [Dreissena polymorpha]